MGIKLSEQVKFDIGLVPQALNDSNETGSWFAMKDFRRVTAVLLGGALANTKASTIELLQAQDDQGTGAKAISSKSATYTCSEVAGVTEHSAYVEADHFDLDKANGFSYVAAKVTTTGDSVVGASLLRSEGRDAVAN